MSASMAALVITVTVVVGGFGAVGLVWAVARLAEWLERPPRR